ncbi:MAG: preQ(1) synthase [Mariprofundaceae bacterium]|nr:preQ(1) synthase [Mariprofundaceae bacterium]
MPQTDLLDFFENPNPERDYKINIESPEFTCVCPKTGQPDFAVIKLSYVPDARCVELKSLKLYLVTFRDEGHFHEKVTNMIADDLIKLLDPRSMTLETIFNVRGGVYTSVMVDHSK